MAHAGLEILEGGEHTNKILLEQREPLLRTKFHVPPLRSNQIARPRLINLINRGLDRVLIVISAPTGYGKTTLVSSWLKDIQVPSTWLSLDDGDNDPIRFLQYFIHALRKIVPEIQSDLLGVLQEMQPAPFEALLNIIINEVVGRATPLILVLDDFHTIYARPVLEIITYLLDHMPLQWHLVLLSRTDPPLPLSRLRVRSQLVDIRADQLRFTREEIVSFLNEVMGLKLPEEAITALEARTEGWIAGLQLAAISMQGRNDVQDFVSAFTGSHYYIMDYLVQEVLNLQNETVRTFLLQTSILDRMCGSLCDEVVKVDQEGSVNGQALLEALEQMNMFIIPLDNERRWYRYHHLFADVLNRRLAQDYPHLLHNLHCRASQWYEENGYIFDSIHHSLMAKDLVRAAQLLDRHGCLLLMSGEVVNLLHWIEAAEPYSQTFPWIAIQKAWALCLTGQLDRTEGPLQTAERLISTLEPSDNVGTMSGAVTAARAYRANLRGETRLAATLARQALDYLPVSSDFSCSLRSAATSILGDASWMDCNLAEAQRAYADAVLISQASGNIHMIIIANSNLANILLEQGKLQQGARKYSETLQMAMLPDKRISPLAERVYAGLGRISYEWNHLEDAEKYIRQCIELSQRWGSVESLAIGYVMTAMLEQAQGNLEKARRATRAAEQLISASPLSPWQAIFLKPALAHLWITQGNLERAFNLVQKSGIIVDGIPGEGELATLQEPWYLILLRLYQAQDDYDAALALSGWLLQKLDKGNRVGRIIETLVLQALAYQGKKDIDQALAALEKAFSLAQPDGYVRTFLDEGEPMTKLLYQAKSRQMGTGYAAELLSVMGNAFGRALPPAELLIEPLTARELEVLKLIEAGYSNQEIAAELVISMPTVKRHISNIYTKLGTSSRTQAVSRGKELNLFQ